MVDVHAPFLKGVASKKMSSRSRAESSPLCAPFRVATLAAAGFQQSWRRARSSSSSFRIVMAFLYGSEVSFASIAGRALQATRISWAYQRADLLPFVVGSRCRVASSAARTLPGSCRAAASGGMVPASDAAFQVGSDRTDAGMFPDRLSAVDRR